MKNRPLFIPISFLLSIALLPGVALAQPDTLKIATWNIEWLNADLNTGNVRRSQADYDRLGRYADRLDADVIALQEVDGPDAARRVFDPNQYNFFFEPGGNTQRVGFAVRKSRTVVDDPDFIDLRDGNSNLRAGAVITVEVGGQPLRLMTVHMKSGCFDRPSTSTSNDCRAFFGQIPHLEQWIDSQAAGPVPFVVLGDFNRRLNVVGDDVWEEIDDANPANADLIKATEGRLQQCWNSRFPEYIDHIVLDRRAADWVVPGSFAEQVFDATDAIFEDELSDHCPISLQLTPVAGTPPPPSGGTDITITEAERDAILARITALEQELAELRRMVEGLD